MSRPIKPPHLTKLKHRKNWFIRDKRTVVSTGTPDEGEAKCFLADYITAKNTPKAPTISILLDMRLDDLKARKTARARNTVFFHNALKSHFGDFQPHQISKPLVTQYWQLRDHVKASLREELFELRSTLKMALNDNLIEKAPFISVPPKMPSRDRFLSQDQALSLLNHATTPHIKLYIFIALRTGARKGAILGLTWDRVDFKHCRIDFTDPTLAESKKRRTIVPVSKDLLKILTKAKEEALSDNVIEFNGKPIKEIKKSFAEIAMKANVEWATPHILKHSVISWLAEDGVSLAEISDLTATHPNTVWRIYRKFSPEYLENASKSLEKAVSFANMFA